jgi:transposase
MGNTKTEPSLPTITTVQSTTMAPSTPKRRRLSRDQRLQVRTLRSAGHSYEDMARLLHVTPRQVEYACQAERPTPKKRSGRPPLLTEMQTQALIEFVTSSRKARLMTYLQLAITLAWGVTEYVIRSAL